MYFRTNNFRIEDSSREIFVPVMEQGAPVSRLSNCKHGVVVARGKIVLLVRSRDGSTKRIMKFDRDVTALEVDGDLIASGDESGHIKIVGGVKSIIREYREHEAAINEMKMYNGTVLVSCSDDMRIKIFDISSAESIATISDNTDYVKSIDIANDIVFSGSYDRSINGYCLKTFKRVFAYKAKGPVSKICYVGDNRLSFTSRNEIFIIDLANLDRPVVTGFVHTKEITRLQYYGGRLYTSSLDASLRVLSGDLRVISKISVRCGILDFNIFEDVVYLGLEDGEVLRLVKEEPMKENVGFRERDGDLEDELTFRTLADPMKKYDDLERKLSRFEYKKSMMDAIKERDIQKVFAVMTFIQEKREFEHALLDLDRGALVDVLDVVIEFFNLKELVPAFIECIGMILFLYEREILDDSELSRRMNILSSVVDDEVYFQEQNLRTISFLECFMS